MLTILKPKDPEHSKAVAELTKFFKANNRRVFFSRQIEVSYEARWFH